MLGAISRTCSQGLMAARLGEFALMAAICFCCWVLQPEGNELLGNPEPAKHGGWCRARIVPISVQLADFQMPGPASCISFSTGASNDELCWTRISRARGFPAPSTEPCHSKDSCYKDGSSLNKENVVPGICIGAGCNARFQPQTTARPAQPALDRDMKVALRACGVSNHGLGYTPSALTFPRNLIAWAHAESLDGIAGAGFFVCLAQTLWTRAITRTNRASSQPPTSQDITPAGGLHRTRRLQLPRVKYHILWHEQLRGRQLPSRGAWLEQAKNSSLPGQEQGAGLVRECATMFWGLAVFYSAA